MSLLSFVPVFKVSYTGNNSITFSSFNKSLMTLALAPAIFSVKTKKMTLSQNAILLAIFLIWLSKMLTSSAHDEKLASRGKNYQTWQIFVSRPREGKFSPKFCRTRAEQAEQTASRGKVLSCLPQVCAGLYAWPEMTITHRCRLELTYTLSVGAKRYI